MKNNMNKKEKLELIAKLQAEVDSMPDEGGKRWRAEEGDYYYKKNESGEPSISLDRRDIGNENDYKTGNYHRTKELCEADTFLEDITAIRDHVRECGEIGRIFYNLIEEDWRRGELMGHETLCYKTDVLAGKILPITATEEQKEERLRLIKKLIV